MITPEHLFVLALLVFSYGLVSKKLSSSIITGPLAFVGFGLLLAPSLAEHLGFESMFGEIEHLDSIIHILGEITLVVVLFSDAAQIRLASLRKSASLPVRLLLIGMPLTIVWGALLAWLLLPALGLWELALLAVILAPTDAALGQAVVSDQRVPLRIRQGLTVESGLNDGIAVPLVLLFAALASMGYTHTEHPGSEALSISFPLKQLAFGPIVGLVVGSAGAVSMTNAIRRNWMSHTYQELAGVALALIAYVAASEVGGNGFIAAFVAGIVVGNSSKEVCSCLYDFAEAESQLLMLATFFLVGLGLFWDPILNATWNEWLYAGLSLTCIRMLPVALSLIGLGLRTPTVLFLGWFGPRGLASVLFAVLIIEELTIENQTTVVRVTLLTVLFSVILHGMTAAPLSAVYSRYIKRRATHDCAELASCSSDLVRKKSIVTPESSTQDYAS